MLIEKDGHIRRKDHTMVGHEGISHLNVASKGSCNRKFMSFMW